MKNGNKIAGFDALRAFSVTLVILSHIGILQMATGTPFAKVFSIFNADYGVKTFFVLSGFLITTLLLKEHRTYGGVNVFHFVMRRVFRILPLYYVIIILAVTLRYFYITYMNSESVIYGSLLIYNYIPRDKTVHFLAHLWSLAVEEQFYVIWPFIFAALARSKVSLVTAAVITVIGCWIRMVTGYGELNQRFYVAIWTIPAIYPIMVGCIAAIIVDSKRDLFQSRAALAISSVSIFIPLVTSVGPTLEIVSTSGIAGLVAWIYLNQQNGFVQRMDIGPIGYVGAISYGLYMWQGMLTGNGSYRATPGWPPDVYTGALLTIPVAMLTFHLFEKRLAKFGRKSFPPDGGSRKAAEAAAE
jgi:peptidoglycan/LPS O-acetylase OafA/YrhL